MRIYKTHNGTSSYYVVRGEVSGVKTLGAGSTFEKAFADATGSVRERLGYDFLKLPVASE